MPLSDPATVPPSGAPTSPRSAPRRRALPSLLLVAVLAGCTGGAGGGEAYPLPEASDFVEGSCALVATDVLALGRAARLLGDGPAVDAAVLTDLEDAQRSLRTVASTDETGLAPLLEPVVTRAGLVRLAADLERYEPTVDDPLQESYAALVEVCTGDGPVTPTTSTG